MANPAKTVDQNLLPVQAYFNLDGSFNTFIGQNMPFYATVNPVQSGLTITNSTIDSSTIGATSPSTGVFTNILTTTGQITTGPSANTDITNKLYVDTVAQGLGPKAACQCGTTANITLSGLQTIDGYTTLAGDRVLVKNQSTQANNGIYIASASTWTRSADMDNWSEVSGAYTVVLNGGQAETGWVCTSPTIGTIGVTAITFVQFSTVNTYYAGTGLTLASNTFSITNTGVSANSYGSASNTLLATVNAQGQLTSLSATPIAIANTQVSGLGTMSTQNANSVAITGGSINGTTIGGSTASAITGTTITATSSFSGSGSGLTGTATSLNIGGNAATATFATSAGSASTATTATTATNLAGGAAGSVPYQASSGSTSFLAAGTNGQYLTLASGLPTWTSLPSNVNSFSAGTTGFSPSTATTGAVTLSGTLNVANGGTGVTTSSGANSVVLRDASGNITTNCLFESYITQTASGTTIVLTAATAQNYQISGSGGQIIRLPDATTLPSGATFTFNNNQSSGAITVQNNSSTTISTVNSGGYVVVNLLSNSTAAGSWDKHDLTPSNVSWSTNTLDYPGSITSASWNGNTIAYNRGGTGQSALFTAGGIVYGASTTAMGVSAAGTTGQVLTSAGSGTPTWTTPTAYATVTDDTTTNSTRYPLYANQTSGNLATEYTSSTKLQYNPSTGAFTSTSFTGAGTGLTGTAASLSIGGNAATATSATSATTATNLAGGLAGYLPYQSAVNTTTFLAPGTNGYILTLSAGLPTWAAAPATGVTISDDTTTATAYYPLFAKVTSGSATTEYVSSTKLNYTPSTGLLAATSFSGAGTGLTGTASGLSIGGTALNVTGTVAVANGGTGLTSTPTNGQVDIGNGTGFTRSTITGTASQVAVTNGSGSITLSLPSTINVNTSGNAATATSATTATNIAGGTNLQIPYQTGAGATSFITAPTIASTYLQYNGTGFVWATAASGGVTSVLGTAPINVSTTLGVATVSITQATTSTNGYLSSTDWNTFNNKGSGTITSVAQSFTGGIISVSGSPITTSGTLALTVAGTSGGIPYFSSGTTWATSAALASNALMVGGGAGVAPSTITTGTGVVTALGVNTGSTGAFVVNGGALGTPSSGTVTNLTGTASININGTVGATTANTGAFTTISASGVITSTVTTGTAPFTVASTTAVANLSIGGNAATATSATNIAGGTVGAIHYQSAAGATAFLTGNTTTTPQFVTSTGTGTVAQAPTLTSSTGSGSVVLATSPTLVTPALGTPSALVGTNITGTASGLSIGGAAPAGSLSGTTLNSTVVTSSLTSVGTIGTGVWQGTAIGAIYGGTAQTTYATGDTLYASATNTLSKLTVGTTGQVLTVAGGVPTWATPTGGGATITGTTTAGTYYVIGTTSTSGSLTTASISNTNVVSYNANTGALSAVSMVSSSDERLKTDWEDLPVDFVENLAKVKHGNFTRIANGNKEVGVSAQSLQSVLPRSVLANDEGMLSVNYGSAALVAAIELAKQVMELKQEIALLKGNK